MSDLQKPQILKPFTRFCMTIGNLPSSYLVSLTYEEQLLWLCDYIKNTVIPAVNNNAESLSEVQKLYIELKEYVDNYFTNLNVQQQIDNKLDEMAEDGTLASIINQDVFNGINASISQNTTDISELKTKVNQNTSDISSITTKVNQNITDINNLENRLLKIKNSNLYNKWYQLRKPEGFNSNFFDNLKIYYNQNKFDYSIDIDSLLPKPSHTWYVSPTRK